MKTVIPLCVGSFDLESLRQLVSRHTDIDLNTKVGVSVESLVILSRLLGGVERDDYTTIAKGRTSYKHLFYGFVVVVDEERKNLWLEHASVDLSVFQPEKLSTGCVLLATGSLRDWHRTLIDNLVPERSPALREQLKQILTWFDQIELTPVFSRYRRQYDSTLYLEEK